MKLNRHRIVPIAILASLCASLAGAQQERAPSAVLLEAEEEEVRRYSVELIVFEYADSAASTEIFEPEGPVVPDTAGPDTLPTGDVAGDDPEPRRAGERLADLLLEPLDEVPTLERAGFEILKSEDYQLDNIYNRLDRLDAYRPLMRAAWIQPALEQDETIPLKLRRIGNPPLHLNGTVTLYLSRFLHLVVDMSLEEKSPVRPIGGNRRIDYFGDNRVNSRTGLDSIFTTPAVFYRIQEDRILRNGELRYYDHPKFGVLAQVMRIEEEPSETTDDTAELLPANP